MKTSLLLASAILVSSLSLAKADGGHFGSPVFATKDTYAELPSYDTDAEKITMHVAVKHPDDGSKVEASWIAVKVEGAEANFKIDAATIVLQKDSSDVRFSMSRPRDGWPAGLYKVDLLYKGAKEGEAYFLISK